MRWLVTILAALVIGCGPSLVRSPRPFQFVVLTEYKTEGDISYRIEWVDVTGDTAPEYKLFFLLDGIRYEEKTDRIVYRMAQHPAIVIHLRDGWYQWYKEIDTNCDGIVDIAWEDKNGTWILVGMRDE